MTARVAAGLLMILGIAAAILAGLLPATITPIGMILVLVAGLMVVSALLLRRALRVVSFAPPTPSVDTTIGLGAGGDEVGDPADLRWSRLMFYLGTLTVAQATFRLPLGLTVSEIFFFAALAGCAFAALRGHPVASLPRSLAVGVGLFAFGGAISSFGAQSLGGSLTDVIHGIYVMFLWGWTGAMVLRTRAQTTLAITLWAASAAIDGAAALAQVVGIHSVVGPLQSSRATGFTDHPNDLGGATGIALAPCLLLTTRSSTGRTVTARLLPWILLAFTAAGLILSASVTGMVVALAGIVIWLSLPSVRTPSRVAVVAAFAAILLVVAVVGGGVTSPAKRIEQVTSPAGINPGAGSGEIRLSEAKTAWPRIKENPIIGTGLDVSDNSLTVLSGGQVRTYQAHGAPLAVWYGAGIFGLIGLLVVFGTLLLTGWRALGRSNRQDDILTSWALSAAVVAFLIFAMAQPFAFQQYGWFAAVMLLAWYAQLGAARLHLYVAEPVVPSPDPRMDAGTVRAPLAPAR